MNWLTYGYIGLVVVLALIFLFRRYVQRWLAVFAHGLFTVSLVGAVVGLLSIRPFVYLAERSLQQSGTLATLQQIDQALPVDKVVTPVADFWENVKNLWNGTPLPTPAINSDLGENKQELGLLEAEVYPQLVLTVAKSYRIGTMGVSVLGLVLSIYLSYVVAQSGEVRKLEERVKKLEGIKD